MSFPSVWVVLLSLVRVIGIHPYSSGFPCDSASKEAAYNAGDLGSIPGLGRSPGEGKDYPLQYSGLENSMKCIVHVVTKSQTLLSDWVTFTLSLTAENEGGNMKKIGILLERWKRGVNVGRQKSIRYSFFIRSVQFSRSVVSDSLRLHQLYSPWNTPG